MNSLKRVPGPVMIDIVGTTLGEDDTRRLGHLLTGGVILFARNYENRAQLVALTEQIRAVRDDVIIAVDHEGGRVQRFRTDGFTRLPPMRAVGQFWDNDALAATRVATALGYVIGSELRASGIDLSFTPVLDLDHGQCQAIGDRAFHADPRVVTMLAKSLNHGLALTGMANCGKHFPGHGFVEADSHHASAIDDRPLEQILTGDAAPYDWLGLSLAAVMPAHVIYPAVDARPAGFSDVWLQRVLRERLGFTGVIFSDDLSMEAAGVAGGMTDRARAALEAGCDMVLVCNRPDEVDRVLHDLRFAPPNASVRRIKRLVPRGKATRWAKLQRQDEYRSARALLVATFGVQDDA